MRRQSLLILFALHPQEILTLDDPDERLSIDIFLSVTNASEATYNSVIAGIIRRYPDSRVLTYHRVKRLITQSLLVLYQLSVTCASTLVWDILDLCAALTCCLQPLWRAARYESYDPAQPGKYTHGSSFPHLSNVHLSCRHYGIYT